MEEETTVSRAHEVDDPVVRRIQVYVNRIPTADGTDAAQAFLLQYPLRPVYRPYGDQGRRTSVQYRQQQRTLQIQYELSIDSENFDASRRAEIFEAQMMGDARPKEHPETIHTLTSMPCISPHSSYGLGVFKDDRLYITR